MPSRQEAGLERTKDPRYQKIFEALVEELGNETLGESETRFFRVGKTNSSSSSSSSRDRFMPEPIVEGLKKLLPANRRISISGVVLSRKPHRRRRAAPSLKDADAPWR